MIESHTSPTLPHPIIPMPSLTSNAVSTVVSSGAQQSTSSHIPAITETIPVEETIPSQQNGMVCFCIYAHTICTSVKMYVHTVYTLLHYCAHMLMFCTYILALMTAEDTKAALRTFDEHLHLMTLIEPCCIQESLQTSELVPNGDLLTGTPSLPGSTVMDNVLKEVRICIEHNGAEKFLMFINVLQTEGRYVVLGCHIFSKLLHACMCT